jgi:Spy/CpxP family protein refolding chaperone
MRKALVLTVAAAVGLTASGAHASPCKGHAKGCAHGAKAAVQEVACSKDGCGCDKLFAKLGLSDEQAAKVAAIHKESACGRKPPKGTCPKKLSAKRKACMAKIMSVLTEEQKAKFAELCPAGKCKKHKASN